jgi:cytochrome c oxidase subunit 1
VAIRSGRLRGPFSLYAFGWSGLRYLRDWYYSEALGKLHFWLMFVGANIAFRHFLGLAGMPLRIADYPAAFASWNFVAP